MDYKQQAIERRKALRLLAEFDPIMAPNYKLQLAENLNGWGEFEEAREVLREILTCGFSSFTERYSMITALLHAGMDEEAIKYFAKNRDRFDLSGKKHDYRMARNIAERVSVASEKLGKKLPPFARLDIAFLLDDKQSVESAWKEVRRNYKRKQRASESKG